MEDREGGKHRTVDANLHEERVFEDPLDGDVQEVTERELLPRGLLAQLQCSCCLPMAL